MDNPNYRGKRLTSKVKIITIATMEDSTGKSNEGGVNQLAEKQKKRKQSKNQFAISKCKSHKYCTGYDETNLAGECANCSCTVSMHTIADYESLPAAMATISLLAGDDGDASNIAAGTVAKPSKRVRVSVQAALANQNNGALSRSTPGLTTPACLPMPGLATPYGLNRPLNRTLKDRIPQAKEIKMGRVPGPLLSSPLTDLQCHPVGVVPKKHSSEWHTIYHLWYPAEDIINDHIPKDLYSLQYVGIDDAIRLLQTLSQDFFMAD
ncbi:hypothetical protein ACROYT_G015010 [Oculina patagonica]